MSTPKTYGKIKSIREVHDITNGNRFNLEGSKGAQLGSTGMIHVLIGGQSMDGYEIVARETILILIDNGQSCCESWGYMTSDDDLQTFVGKTLHDIVLTDTKLATWSAEVKPDDDYYDGGIQFVTFETSGGSFQIAVYNSHNGYYGHGILVAAGDKIIHQDTL